ncbi:hypothetical protein VNO80_05599 [Phaseolus coccineus]|uniref:Uncharacterized protein n=1 Tax=Phaseolus coccineus TaxID=3886 RepID=A0AAN9NFX8_PHACN
MLVNSVLFENKDDHMWPRFTCFEAGRKSPGGQTMESLKGGKRVVVCNEGKDTENLVQVSMSTVLEKTKTLANPF